MGASETSTVGSDAAGRPAGGAAGAGGRGIWTGAIGCMPDTGVTAAGAGAALVASTPAPATPAATAAPPAPTLAMAPAAVIPSPAGRGRRALRSAAANSSAVWYLSAAFLLSARIATPARASETAGWSVRGFGGAVETCCMATATSVSPRKGTRPVSIS